MRVIVCGGRDYGDVVTIRRELEEFTWAHRHEDVTVVHGDAPGADRHAGGQAKLLQLPVDEFPADWHGPCRPECYHRPRKAGEKCPAAGVYRNQEMLDAGADLVIAFPGGRGTADMVSRARETGVEVYEVPDG